jgi:uncharacterized protein YabN with tetrapyrrole methylase and pyrophosphatase domain
LGDENKASPARFSPEDLRLPYGFSRSGVLNVPDDMRETSETRLATGSCADLRENVKGSLVVVGTGIKAISQITAEAEAHIRRADKVFYGVTEPAAERWMQSLNRTAESLRCFYAIGKDRNKTYEEIICCLVSSVIEGAKVCCALYGHPAVFAYPGREAVRRLLQMGFSAVILPGISAEDCLFADLGVDPGATGCQSFEATDFLIHKRRFDTRSLLVLWQVGLIGVPTTPVGGYDKQGLQVLTDYLIEHYGTEQAVTLYEASQVAETKPRIVSLRLRELASARPSVFTTLYVPPASPSNPDSAMMSRLGLDAGSVSTAAMLQRHNLPQPPSNKTPSP